MPLENVLLALAPADADRVDGLVETAGDVAGPAGATVTVAYVFDESEYESALDELDIDRETESLSADDLAEREVDVREVTRQLDARGLASVVRGAVGHDAAEEVIALAAESDADLVVVGGSRRSPAGKAVFGDRAQQILLQSPCPVVYVQRTE